MRSLFILCSVFALLVTYMETSLQQKHPTVQPVTVAKIVREPVTITKTVKTKQIAHSTPKPQPSLPSLNLQLPTLERIEPFRINPATSKLKLSKKTPGKSISYNAELIFDREKGEDITGGKVNITIPFG